MSTSYEVGEYFAPEKTDDLKRKSKKTNSDLFNRKIVSTRFDQEVSPSLNISNFTGTNFQTIGLPIDGGFSMIKSIDIIRCCAFGNYTKVFLTGNRSYVVSRSLKEFEDVLDQKSFSRIHHSNIINLFHLEKYVRTDGGYVIMNDGTMHSVSRNRKDEFLKNIILL